MMTARPTAGRSRRTDRRSSGAAAPPPVPGSTIEPMTREQAARLKSLAGQALEPESFHPALTAEEAARRIAVLEVKLRMMDGPPHTV